MLVVSHIICSADWTALADVRLTDSPLEFPEVTALKKALPIAEGPSLRALYASV